MAGEERNETMLAVCAVLLFGGAVGLGLFTARYADATSYLSNDPGACANCHVMQGHLDAWIKSSHGKFAGCNDCHAPHDSFVGKYYTKARNGYFHSLAFTTGDYPLNLRINDFNREVTENACRSCHAAMTHRIEPAGVSSSGADSLQCIQCHSTVGHDR